MKKGSATGIMMGVGVALGAGVAAALENIPIGAAVGVALGSGVGGLIDLLGKKEQTESDETDPAQSE